FQLPQNRSPPSPVAQMRVHSSLPPLTAQVSVFDARLVAYEWCSAIQPPVALVDPTQWLGLPQQIVLSSWSCAQLLVAPAAGRCPPRVRISFNPGWRTPELPVCVPLSWPSKLSPQHSNWPLICTAQTCFLPTLTDWYCVPGLTMYPSLSCDSLNSQQYMACVLEIAQLCRRSVSTATKLTFLPFAVNASTSPLNLSAY